MLGNLIGLPALGYFQQAKYLAVLPQAAVAPASLRSPRDDPARFEQASDLVQYVVVRVVPLGIALFAETQVLQRRPCHQVACVRTDQRSGRHRSIATAKQLRARTRSGVRVA